jgi:hypothetical protein
MRFETSWKEKLKLEFETEQIERAATIVAALSICSVSWLFSWRSVRHLHLRRRRRCF